MSEGGKPKLRVVDQTMPEAIQAAIKAAFGAGYEAAVEALDDIGKAHPDAKTRTAIRYAANLLKGMRP
jgi:hypothetical protein